jgi:hypothetical protein
MVAVMPAVRVRPRLEEVPVAINRTSLVTI